MNARADTWVTIGHLADIPLRGARTVTTRSGDVAVFRTASGEIFAIEDRCPHRGGPLSQGIVHDDAVTCPLHNWVICLRSGAARGADSGCVKTLPVRLDADRISIDVSAYTAREAG
jgi:nitrite reductase (NADH) small subunit